MRMHIKNRYLCGRHHGANKNLLIHFFLAFFVCLWGSQWSSNHFSTWIQTQTISRDFIFGTFWRTSLENFIAVHSAFFLFWSSIYFSFSLCIKATSNGLWVTANDYVHSPFLFTLLIHFERYCLWANIVGGSRRE